MSNDNGSNAADDKTPETTEIAADAVETTPDPKSAPAADAQAADDKAVADKADSAATETAEEWSDAQPPKPTVREVAAARRAEAEGKRSVTIPVGALGWGSLAFIVIAALIAGLVVFAVRDFSARDQLSSIRTEQANKAKAEEVASKYAVGASTVTYQDVQPWLTSMKTGVSPELAKKYDSISNVLQQMAQTLQLQMSGSLVLAKTSDVAGNIYNVQVVVNVTSSNIQQGAAKGMTVVYGITLDKSQNWQITAVGDPTDSTMGSLLPGLQQQGQPSGAPAPAPVPAPTPAPGG